MKSNFSGRVKEWLGFGLTPVSCFFALLSMLISCGPAAKIKQLKTERMSASIRLPTYQETRQELFEYKDEPTSIEIIGPDGKKQILMQAVKDDDTGEMVASETIQAAYISTRFKNVAERGGEINLQFQIVVPALMQDPSWQLRFHPKLYIKEDSLLLDDVLITGSEYRRNQVRGYQRYEDFLKKIINDDSKLIDMRSFELFIERNIPQLYVFRNDTSIVSEASFVSALGVSAAEAKDHYTKWLLVKRNQRLIASKSKRFKSYVPIPFRSDGVKVDTVSGAEGLEFVYDYTQTLKTRPKLKKISLVLSGEVFEGEQMIYTIPDTEALTYYISSVSSLADTHTRYKTEVISRNLNTKQNCIINFKPGKSDINVADNSAEIDKIKASLRQLMEDESLEIDSIVVVATCSPEGSKKSNMRLSYNRAKAVTSYFSSYLQTYKDSIASQEFVMDMNGSGPALATNESRMKTRSARDISFSSHSGGENWSLLDIIVEQDTTLSNVEYAAYCNAREENDLDKRESLLKKHSIYPKLFNEHYPKLRVVYFDFFLHRRGMIKDTVITNVVDTCYMQGLEALQDQDYQRAIDKLNIYQDYNTALACIGLGRNYSAMAILDKCEDNAKNQYLKALLYSRMGDERQALECLLRACNEEASYIHRANLDPEISTLKSKYNLFGE